MIWLLIGLILGYFIGINHRSETRVVVAKDEDLIKDLTIANNLNKSLLQDKLDLQQEVRKLQEKSHGIRSKSSKNQQVS